MGHYGLECCDLRHFSAVVGIFGTWEFPKIGVPYFGVLIARILLFRVLY